MKRLFLVLALAFTGCDPSSLRDRLDLRLSDVDAFTITAADADVYGQSSHKALSAVLMDGTTRDVQVTAGEIDGVSAEGVYSTPNWILFAYRGVTYHKASCDFVAVRRSDSAAFCVPASFNTVVRLLGLQSAPDVDVEVGSSPDTIFIAHDPGLVRLDLAGDHPVETVIVPANTDEAVKVIATNEAGDLAAQEVFGGAFVTHAVRVYRSDGGLDTVLAQAFQCLTRGLPGEDDVFYFVGAGGVYRLAPGADGTFGATLFAAQDPRTGSPTIFADCRLLHRSADRILVEIEDTRGPGVFEMVNPEHTFARRSITGLPSTILDMRARGDDLYVWGKGGQTSFVVMRYGISTGDSLVLLDTAGYAEIGAPGILSDGDVAFSALRLGDNARVQVQVDGATGAVQETVLPSEEPAVIALEAIH